MASPPEKDISRSSSAVATNLHDGNKEESKGQDVRETADTQNTTPSAHLLGAKSPGVQRVEAISQHFRLGDRVLFFFGIFLIAYAYGLDGMLRTTYQVRKPLFLLILLVEYSSGHS